MKGKIIVGSIALFLLVLFSGAYFLYQAEFSDTSLDRDEANLHGDRSQDSQSNREGHSATGANGNNADGKGKKFSKVLDASSTKNQNSKNQNSKNNETVVDQTLHAISGKDENGNVVPPNVLGAVKEKIIVELSLFDGEENKILSNYDVEFKYKFNTDSLKSEGFKTDKDGKFIFTTTKSGFVTFQFFTKDFSIHTKFLNLRHGKNEYLAKLYKGGIIEVKATNVENKVVTGLTAKLGSGWRGRQTQDYLPLELDAARGVYFLANVPVGTQDIAFKAANYVESSSYKLIVDSKNAAFLEIKLIPSRMITFDLDVQTKPDLINVTNRKFSRGRNRNNNNQQFENAVMTYNSNVGGGQQTVIDSSSSQSTQTRGRQGRGVGNRNPGGFGGLAQPVNLGVDDSIEVLKNPDGLYYYELEDNTVTSLTVYADRFAPKDVNLAPDKDIYKISLVEGAVGELQINDESGKPVIGASVTYSSGNFRQVAISGDDGLATLIGLSSSMAIRLSVTCKSYAAFNDNWAFDAKESRSKAIVLIVSKGLSGKVKFDSKPVMGAKVLLYQGGNNFPIGRVESASDGSFNFENVDMQKDKSYTIKAFHRDYGVAVSQAISFAANEASAVGAEPNATTTATNKIQSYDLNLVEEKSLSLKLVDGKGAPLPNKNFTITNNMESEFSSSIVTDEKGEYVFLNLMHGNYQTKLEDNKLKIKNRNVQIPAGELTLTAETKELKKIVVTTQDGKTYTGSLNVSVEMNRNSWPLDVITGEDGGYYLESRDDYPLRFGTFIFEAQGYAVARLGPFEKTEDMPKEFVVELQEGESFKVKVVDDITDNPMPYIAVDILTGRTKIQTLPTNELGEILFVHLNSKFTVTVKEDNYCAYTNEFDGTKTKEMNVRMIKGGGIKGHLTIGKEVSVAWVSLQPGGNNLPLDADGNFEFFNLTPGEYTLSISRNLKDGKNQNEKIPLRIVVENEKIFEINLDDFQKNQTTLDVSVFRDGNLSTEQGFLNITDRKGQSVVATQITNGKYLVERIFPGEYLLSYNYMGKALQKTLAVLPRQTNAVDLFVPGSSLTIAVKNEEGNPIPKVMITLYAGEKYRQEDSYLGNQLVADANGTGTFLLMPKAPYYFVVEEDFRFNYQVNVIGPVILEAGQSSRLDYVLPYAKKLPKIQITDNANKPLANVGFIFSDEGGNFFQRTLKKEWDLFPYSSKNGFLPENCWPKGNFTLVVGKEGFEFKEIAIGADYDPNQPLQIKLNKASSIRCNFPNTMPLPVSVGILNKNGVLLQKPIPLPNRTKNELTVYYENISFGSVTFSDLGAGTYYIGYFWNGSNRIITRQGPFQLGVEENLNVTSTLQITDY